MSRINFLECARAVQKTSSIFTQSYEKKVGIAVLCLRQRNAAAQMHCSQNHDHNRFVSLQDYAAIKLKDAVIRETNNKKVNFYREICTVYSLILTKARRGDY